MRLGTYLRVALLLVPLAACGIKGPLNLPPPQGAQASADHSKPAQDEER